MFPMKQGGILGGKGWPQDEHRKDKVHVINLKKPVNIKTNDGSNLKEVSDF